MKGQRFFLLNLRSIASHAYRFRADNASSVESTNLPAFYNLSASQVESPVGSSYYSSSFITTNDRLQYMVLSHILLSPAPESYARYSIIEVSDPTNFWSNFQYFTTPASPASNATSVLDLNVPGYEFRALSPDGFSTLQTSATTETFAFNITWHASSPVIYNAGVGTFNFGGGETNQWSMPAGATSGTITVDDTELTIDPHNSFTWYDRQFSTGSPVNGNWTWLELHFDDDAGLKASVWAIDQRPAGTNGSVVSWQFATVRDGSGSLSVLPYTLRPDAASAWTSLESNITYPTKWSLEFAPGDELVVTSVREDQELFSEKQVADNAYQGFATHEGTLFGKPRRGFGLMEVVPTVLN